MRAGKGVRGKGIRPVFWEVLGLIGGVIFVAVPLYAMGRTWSRLPAGRRPWRDLIRLREPGNGRSDSRPASRATAYLVFAFLILGPVIAGGIMIAGGIYGLRGGNSGLCLTLSVAPICVFGSLLLLGASIGPIREFGSWRKCQRTWQSDARGDKSQE